MTSRIAFVAAAGLTLAATAGLAQQTSDNQVATMTAWSVFEEADPRECWAVSAPEKTVNTRNGNVVSVSRSEIRFMAFYRPGADVNGQIAFTGGYPFRDGSTVNLNVDGTEFELATEGEWAWPASPSEDARILASLKRGSAAVLTAVSGRGTMTNDTFSLMGFTAAVDEAQKRCN